MGDVDGRGKSAGRLLGGRYRLGDVLGRGGMGTVWRAEDEVLGRTVAVKELRFPSSVDEEEKRRLITRTLREAKAIARIRSNSVITVYDVVDEDDRPWIVMELVEGRSLADALREDGPLEPRRAAEVGLAILDALRAAHREGILHRDVKPSNVLIADEDGRVVLTDFGIAQVEGDPSLTSTGMLVGAPSYIAPERARGRRPGPPSDLWSLGGLLYASVEGRPPYDKGSAIATLTAVMTEPLEPPVRAGVLEEVIHGLLRKDPDQRLDEPAARALLEAAVREPGAADAPAAEGTRTTVLPTAGDGRSVPDGTNGSKVSESSDGPAGPAASNGQGGERLREALRTARNTMAAAAAKPGTGDAGGAGSGAAKAPGPAGKGSGLVRLARLARQPAGLVAVAVVVLAVLGTVLAVTLGGGGDDGDGDRQERSAVSQGTGDGRDSARGAEDGKDGGEDGGAPGEPDSESSGQDGGEDDGEDGEGAEGDKGGQNGGDGEGGKGSGDGGKHALPDGFEKVVDDRFHFSMAMPEGFRSTSIAGQNSGGIYTGPGSAYPKVQVDFTGSPGNSAVGAWKSQEPSVRSKSSGYSRISLKEIEWRDYPTVADWVFERVEQGVRVRVLNRGFKVDGKRGHAIMITCRAEEWDGEECRTVRETAFRTFQPVD